MKNNGKPLYKSLLTNHRIGRRKFIKKAGLSALSLGITPYLLNCDDDEPKFYFAVLSDTHIYPDEEKFSNRMMQLTAEILNNYEVPLDCVFITGDLCDYDESDKPFEQTSLYNLKKYKTLFNMDVYPCMGNHDYYKSEWSLMGEGFWCNDDERPIREALYKEHEIIEDAYYKKIVNNVAFYCLNTHQKDDEIGWQPELVGHFGRPQIEWLKEELDDNMPAMLFFHAGLATPIIAADELYPFEVPRDESNIAKYEGSKYDGYTDPIYNEVLDVMNNQIKGIFVGHSHNFLHEIYNNIPVFMTDTLKETRTFDTEENPMRFHIIECGAGSGRINVYNDSLIIYNVQ